MLTAEQVYAKISTEAKTKARPEVRFVKQMPVGKVFRQGDVYFHRVAGDHSRGEATKTRQLVPGTSQGSRHAAVGEKLRVYAGTTAPSWAPRALLGPCVISPERWTVTHPEHAHGSLPAGTYQLSYQLDASTMERVQD